MKVDRGKRECEGGQGMCEGPQEGLLKMETQKCKLIVY